MSGRGGAPDSHPRTVNTGSAVGVRLLRIRTCHALQAVGTHSARLQSARTSHRHPHRRPSAETAHQAGREDAIQAGSSRTSSRRHCASRSCTERTPTRAASTSLPASHMSHADAVLAEAVRSQRPRKAVHVLAPNPTAAWLPAATRQALARRPHCTCRHTPGTQSAGRRAPRQRCSGCTCCHPCCTDQLGTSHSRRQSAFGC